MKKNPASNFSFPDFSGQPRISTGATKKAFYLYIRTILHANNLHWRLLKFNLQNSITCSNYIYQLPHQFPPCLQLVWAQSGTIHGTQIIELQPRLYFQTQTVTSHLVRNTLRCIFKCHAHHTLFHRLHFSESVHSNSSVGGLYTSRFWLFASPPFLWHFSSKSFGNPSV